MRNLHFFAFYWPHPYGILVPQSGIEPMVSALEAWSLNHWTPREVPNCTFLKDTIFDKFWHVYMYMKLSLNQDNVHIQPPPISLCPFMSLLPPLSLIPRQPLICFLSLLISLLYPYCWDYLWKVHLLLGTPVCIMCKVEGIWNTWRRVEAKSGKKDCLGGNFFLNFPALSFSM